MSELPPWRSPLAKALHRNRSLPHVRFVQLATVDSSGKPHNRTIVYRGLTEDTHQLQFVTDSRSEKISHLAHQTWVEVCWYFTKTREQFRLSGQMSVLDQQTEQSDLRNNGWQRLSDKAKMQFYWPNPGQQRLSDSQFEDISTESQPPAEFNLLLLSPNKIDHLELRGTPQNRTRYHLNVHQTWDVEDVNP